MDQQHKVKPDTTGKFQSLINSGFEVLSGPEPRRGLWLATEGVNKAGKTHFAFTQPGPIMVLSNDSGTRAIAAKAKGRKVIFKNISFDKSDKNQTEHVKIWERFKRDWWAGFESLPIGASVVCDTGTDLWELARLARLGKLTKVLPHNYVEVNSEFSGLFNGAYELRPDINVCIIHKVKKQYVASRKDADKEVWNGKMERAGFEAMRYICDANLRHSYDPDAGEFVSKILDSRYNMLSAIGEELSGENNNWETVASLLADESFEPSI